jgi:hypothetical protein
VLAKEGSLTAGWTKEYGSGATQGSVASDAKNGPLIGIATQSDQVLVKEGSLTAPWNHEHSGYEVAVASDSTHGPLIAALTTKGELLVKQGSLTAGWNREHGGVGTGGGGAGAIGVATDTKHGSLIAAVLFSPDHDSGDLLVKEGSLSASWNLEHINVFNVSIASDAALGPMIGLQTFTPAVLVKIGKLTAPWNHEHANTVQVAVAD